ncbi:flagellin [uncultured Mobiluncus sp.]|uniref:flagellin N-terminal helical domain-containing protein n=1 Tax=uncultured Mobiluncus sp. TaxID=293425 RepID=UPI00260770DC|nr:flagellin [uncultured Mobiluncus sp.]
MTTLSVDGYSAAMSPGMSAAGFSAPDTDDFAEPFENRSAGTYSSGTESRADAPLSLGDSSDADLSLDSLPGFSRSGEPGSPGAPDLPGASRASGAAGASGADSAPGASKSAAGAYSRYAVLVPLGGAPRANASRGGAPRSIATNVMALNAYRYNVSAEQILHQSLQRLSSGKRINSAADDASGLALVQGLKTQVLGNRQAIKNAQDGISLTQTAEGVLSTVHDMLQRMRQLAVQGANDTYSVSARVQIGSEMDAIRVEIGRIGQVTEAMGRRILGGKYVEPADALRFQIGANASDAEVIAITFVDVTDIAKNQIGHIPQDANHEAFQRSIENIDTQIQVISGARATLGALMNRFEHTINNLNVSVENLCAAQSRMQDADLAAESVNFMRGRILSQSSRAVLSQALSAPRGVLSLLSAA